MDVVLDTRQRIVPGYYVQTACLPVHGLVQPHVLRVADGARAVLLALESNQEGGVADHGGRVWT